MWEWLSWDRRLSWIGETLMDLAMNSETFNNDATGNLTVYDSIIRK